MNYRVHWFRQRDFRHPHAMALGHTSADRESWARLDQAVKLDWRRANRDAFCISPELASRSADPIPRPIGSEDTFVEMNGF